MKPAIFLIVLFGVVACAGEASHANAGVPHQQASPGEKAAPVGEAALIAAGPGVTIQEEPDGGMADVIRVDYLKPQGGYDIKLLGWGGGDPAINGLQTQIAFFNSPAEGWHVFSLGDFLDYRILAEGPGRVDLEIEHTILDEVSGDFASGKRRVIVGWPVNDDGSIPSTVTVTPAR